MHKFISIFSLVLGVFFGFTDLTAQMDTAKVYIERIEGVEANLVINNILVDSKNKIWLATNQGLIETNSEGTRNIKHIGFQNIVDVIEDSKGIIWAVSDGAVHHVEAGLAYNLPDSEVFIRDITYLVGSLWIATDNGVYQFFTGNLRFKNYNINNSNLASNTINFIHADKHKIIWIGTDAGYIRVNGENWDLYDKKIKMLATAENNEGQWIISEKDMFLVNSYNRIFPVQLDKSQYENKINAFVFDSKGRIYIASDKLVRYDPYKETNENFTDATGNLAPSTLSIVADNNDNIWVGTDGSGFYKLQFGDILREKLMVSCLINAPIKCYGEADGEVQAVVSGGKLPYKYKWNKENKRTQKLANLLAGTYVVTVTDANGNTAKSDITLDDPLKLNIEVTTNERVTDPEQPDGQLAIQVTGGKAPYKYNWSNGSKDNVLLKLTSGNYIVTVTDQNNCTSMASAIVKRSKFIPDLDIAKISVGQKLRINDLSFDSDSSNISQSNFEVLEEVVEFMQQNESVIVEIGGHTNTIPPHEYCDKLSDERAKNVADYLVSRGISSRRVSYKGYGKREPLTDSTTAMGRAKNQRVEIKIIQI